MRMKSVNSAGPILTLCALIQSNPLGYQPWLQLHVAQIQNSQYPPKTTTSNPCDLSFSLL